MVEIAEVRQDSGFDWYQEGDADRETYYLGLATYGKCLYRADRDKYILEKGELLLIPPYIPFYGKSIPSVLHTKFGLLFKASSARSALPILNLQKPLKLKLGGYDLIHERIKAVWNQWQERPPYYRTMAEALLTEALVYANREWDRGAIPAEKLRHVENMKQYIQKHHREKVTKRELGEAIQKTPNYAAALFRSVTGQTISEYVHGQRIKTAIYMLTESRLSISEIAAFVGYSDVSYFHRLFKRMTGKSPSEFTDERPPTP